jgi:hypothetical protein
VIFAALVAHLRLDRIRAAERFRIRAIFDLGNLPRSTCLGALRVGLRGSAPEDESSANKRESYDNQRDPQSMHFATAKTEMKCEQVRTDGSGQSVRKATKRRFFARTVGIRTLAAGRAAAIALANREFDEPIVLPNGRKLVTLRDTATFITKLPKAEYDAPEWQAAIEALILVVGLGGPTMFAASASCGP